MRVNKKRGQLSYEYIIIAGTLLVVLIPFFYYSFELMHSQLNDYYGGIAVNTIADLTKTASNLFRGSTVEAVIRMPKNLQEISSVGGKHITLRFSNGEDIYALSGGYSVFGRPSLEGGPRTVSVTKVVDGVMAISFGGPVIVCLTIEDRPVSRDDCIAQYTGNNVLSINPSDRLIIVGSNIDGATSVNFYKKVRFPGGDTGWELDPDSNDNGFVYSVSQDEAPIADTITAEQPVYGAGEYQIELLSLDGSVSNRMRLDIGGKGSDSD